MITNKASIVVHFPVLPHVYKYLQNKCGEKIVASKKDFYGGVALDVFAKQGSAIYSCNDEITYPVEISLRYIEEFGIFINKHVIRKFNNRIDKMFREEMRSYVYITNRQNGIAKEKALRQFLFEYNIVEDDIKFETLVKDINRNR
ncbi:hypothetical protein [Flavobacterium beibuense]|uniref:hypothetical protein n=1 Tax=Flavobacterium beibuense TaxID=657326 RepID=UPI003A91E929